MNSVVPVVSKISCIKSLISRLRVVSHYSVTDYTPTCLYAKEFPIHPNVMQNDSDLQLQCILVLDSATLNRWKIKMIIRV